MWLRIHRSVHGFQTVVEALFGRRIVSKAILAPRTSSAGQRLDQNRFYVLAQSKASPQLKQVFQLIERSILDAGKLSHSYL